MIRLILRRIYLAIFAPAAARPTRQPLGVAKRIGPVVKGGQPRKDDK